VSAQTSATLIVAVTAQEGCSTAQADAILMAPIDGGAE
jgi:hypothetical protein